MRNIFTMQEEESIKTRIELLIEKLDMSSRQFSLTVSTSDSFARNIKDNIGSDKIRNILRAFPQVNLYWLIDGEGEMFRNNEGTHIGNENNISGSNITSNGSIDNSINISIPDPGYEKIIKSDRTVEIHKTRSDKSNRHDKNLEEKINLYQKTIESQNLTIKAQQDLIEMLQSKNRNE